MEENGRRDEIVLAVNFLKLEVDALNPSIILESESALIEFSRYVSDMLRGYAKRIDDLVEKEQ